MIKAGMITAVSGLFLSTLNDFISNVALAESDVIIYGSSLLRANLFDWSGYMINHNVAFLVLTGSLSIGAALIVCGIVLAKKRTR